MPKIVKKIAVKSKPKSTTKISKTPKHVVNKSLSKVSAKEIEKASKRIRPIVHWTPLEQSNGMSKMFSANVFIKHEQTQHGGSFKLRGVTNHLKSLTP
jgi:threonine dehydratase